MNYVDRHFGDWARDTAHLKMIEDGAYNRLIDLYYVREQPLPTEIAACCRLVRASTKAERDAVQRVLLEFFVNTPTGWAHKRCDAEIERFRTRSNKARASANTRWCAEPMQSERNANAMRMHSECSTNAMPHAGAGGRAPTPQYPITSIPPSADAAASSELTKVELWTAGKSLLSEQGMPLAQCGTFVGKLVKDHGEEVVVNAVRSAVVEQPADAASWLKAACLKANGSTRSGKHAGFATKNYREGVSSDGSIV